MQPSRAGVDQSVHTTAVQPESTGKTYWIAILLLVAAAFAIRLWCLACKPYWFDETFSVEVGRIDWRNFLHLLWWREANMSLYYVLLRLWLPFGQSPFFIRSLSVVFAAATVPAMFWLGRLLYDKRVGLIAAALFAFNAYDVRYSQEARSYALFVLLATLSSACLIRWLLRPSPRALRGYAAISILAAYAHFYALLLILAQWIALWWQRRPDPSREREMLEQLRRAWILIGVGVLPLLIFVAKTGAGPIKWIQRPGLRELVVFYEHLAGGNTSLLLLMLGTACIVAVYPLGNRIWARNQDWNVWRCQFLLVWLLFPVALTTVLSFARPVFLGRYMIFCLPALLVLASAGIARLRQSWQLGIAMLAVLSLSAQGTFFVYAHDFDNERDAAGAAVNFVLDHAQPGDEIAFHIAETRIPYEFFRSLRAGENTASPAFNKPLGPEILFPRHGQGLHYRDFTGKPTAEILRSVMPGHPRVWIVLMNNGPEGKPDPTTVMLTKTMPEFFPKLSSWKFPKVEVRLYSVQ